MHFLLVANPATPQIKGDTVMNTHTDDHLEDDAFEPVNLGSVSEETRGIGPLGDEFNQGSVNSRE
ncbi:MAG: hypothetical protein VR74_11545 [Hyphomonas sp. BRH_c22]|nr:MAG: hypothetical protein VR74_11545 [Hyphomonas sp. BRH_c22]